MGTGDREGIWRTAREWRPRYEACYCYALNGLRKVPDETPRREMKLHERYPAWGCIVLGNVAAT